MLNTTLLIKKKRYKGHKELGIVLYVQCI